MDVEKWIAPGHWLDEEWKLQSKLLDFAYIEGSHTGQNHSVILSKCLDRLNIAFSNIQAITADNAGSNNTMFEWLDDYGISAVTSQVRCLAHVLNLAVQDMLASLKVPSHCDPDYDNYLENEVGFCINLVTREGEELHCFAYFLHCLFFLHITMCFPVFKEDIFYEIQIK